MVLFCVHFQQSIITEQNIRIFMQNHFTIMDHIEIVA